MEADGWLRLMLKSNFAALGKEERVILEKKERINCKLCHGVEIFSYMEFL